MCKHTGRTYGNHNQHRGCTERRKTERRSHGNLIIASVILNLGINCGFDGLTEIQELDTIIYVCMYVHVSLESRVHCLIYTLWLQVEIE